MLVSALYVLLSRLLELALLCARGDRAKELETLVLRHELSVLRRLAGRPRFEEHDRLLLAALTGASAALMERVGCKNLVGSADSRAARAGAGLSGRRLVRADQYGSFLENPDPNGPGRAVYVYETVAAPAPSVAPPEDDGGGTSTVLIALVAFGSVALAGGAVVLWAHS